MAELRVSNIEQMRGTDGDIWVVSFEDKKLKLTEKEEPSYDVGDILPFQVKVHKPPEGQQGDWYYYRASSSAPPKQSPKETKTFTYKNDDDIMLQVAFKGAIECEKVWYVPDGKAHTDRVLENTALLNAGLHLLKPKHDK